MIATQFVILISTGIIMDRSKEPSTSTNGNLLSKAGNFLTSRKTRAALGLAGAVLAIGPTAGCTPAEAPQAPTISATPEATPTPTPSATETPTPSATESATPSDSPEPTESATTPEKQSHETLSNENTYELDPALAGLYEGIADKVQGGDITFKKFLKLTPGEQALVQQALFYRATVNGSSLMDVRLCSQGFAFLSDDPGCNANFASKDDTNYEVLGKNNAVASAALMYTTDGARGQVKELDPEASRILLGAPYEDPYSSSAENRIGQHYSYTERYVNEGVLKSFVMNTIEVDNPDASGETTRRIHATIEEEDGRVTDENTTLVYKTYKVDGSKADKSLGLQEQTTIKLARWEVRSSRFVTSG